jgi:uncharacterized protein (TIGR02265 family)
VSPSDRAIEWVAPYCDIVERLELVPPSACVRGVYFQNVETQIATHGLLDAYRQYFPNDHYTTFPLYPVAEILVRRACAGALIATPERVHEGMFLVAKGNATAFAASLLGRVMLRKLSPDPVRLLEQAVAARRQSTTYGHWEIRRHGDRALEVVYSEEYSWIESAIAGAAQGTFEACGITAQIETRLIDRFNGSTFFRW